MANILITDRYLSTPFPDSANSLYVLVQQAGSGSQGTVYFCLPRASIPAVLPRTAEDFSTLRAQLVAVKVVLNLEKCEAQENRRQILDHLKNDEAAGTTPTKYVLPRILTTHLVPLDESRPWYTMSAVYGCTVAQVLEQSLPLFRPSLPPALVAHIFLEIHAALTFLHGKDISHMDIHTHNVMLETSGELHVPGFPNVLLVDFGFVRERSLIPPCPDVSRLVKLIGETTGDSRRVQDLWRGECSSAALVELDRWYLEVDDAWASEVFCDGVFVLADGSTLESVMIKWGGIVEGALREKAGLEKGMEGVLGEMLRETEKGVGEEVISEALEREGLGAGEGLWHGG
ncbi:hypothetical protein K505DRAFT_358704 [Melanomma pulvis-pyrius CBS 109.77]|uniref:Protein kinase domain-containing protein n=1 Tax=Melanomma pulvis-pyrius CBS 109.77 TaxID=1314802 RepID=A0A6A6XKR1_9PLEO|nr:hypothetical protein K505DRAFT_358704 [Melanomma pulvis-pyrius CBS 109.77]